LQFSRAVTRAQATTGVLLVLGVLFFPTRALAQARMEFIPSMSLFTVYDDNIFARVNGSAGQMLQLRPSLEGSYENPRVRLLGLYSFDMQRSNFSSLNTLDARRHALGETRFRTSPFTTLGFIMRYDRSETPGELDADSGFLGERRQAERIELNPTYARRFDTRTSMTAGYDWTTENLIEGERGTLHIGRTTLSREVTTRTTLSAGYVGRYFVDHIADHTSHGIVLGWNRELAPGTRVSFFAGPKVRSYGGLTPEASASFARSTNRIRLAVDYWHGETIVLGVQGPVRADSITTRSTWPLTRRFELSTHAGVSDVTTLDARNSTIYRGTLGASWSPGGLYTVAASYGLDYQDGTIRNRIVLDDQPIRFDDRILRHVFRVSVTVAPRYGRSILPPDEAARAKGVTR
jgi:hypothetical protein